MNLVIDIGNTVAKLVAFSGNEPIEAIRTPNHSLEHLHDFAHKHPFERGIVSTVIGLSTQAQQQLEALPFPLLHLNHTTPLPIVCNYHTPHTLGPDRIAAAVGAWSQQPGHPILVIDAGTCITYEYIDHNGHYHGGSISPGLQMRLRSLHAFTGKLPLVDGQGPLPEVGYDTDTCIRTGVVYGIQQEMAGRIRQFEARHPGLLVFLTGGDVFDFDTKIKSHIFADRLLVPKGLNSILQFNNEKT